MLSYHLSSLSTALARCGHTVEVVSGPQEQVSGLSRTLEQFGVKHHVVRHIDNPHLGTILKCSEQISEIAARGQADLVHAQGTVHALTACVARRRSARRWSGAIATTVHSIPSHQTGDLWWRQRVWATCVTLNLCSDEVLTVSNYTKERVVENGVQASKTFTVYNGVDVNGIDSAVKEAQDAWLRRDTQPAIVNVANLIPGKGQDAFLMAAREVLKSTEATFYIVGDGPRGSDLRSLARSLGIQNSVVFTGRIQWPAVYSFMNDIADICVLSSTRENFPYYMLECMALRKPLVSTEVGGIPEAIAHGANGLLVPPSNPRALALAILRLIRDPELAKEMGRNGRMAVEEKFDISRQADQLAQRYAEVATDK